MSKDIPEKGDVWVTEDGSKLHIMYVNNDDEYEVFAQNADATWIVNMEFLEDYTYLGKAKGSISDLFEIKDKNDE